MITYEVHDGYTMNEDDKEPPRYDSPELQAAYEFACEWLFGGEEAAADICYRVGQYGSTVALVSADEWEGLTEEERSWYHVLIGEDINLTHYVIELA